MRDEPDDDEPLDAVLLELQIQVRVGETAGTPVLRGDNLARPGLELGTDLTAPRAVFEALMPPRRLLNGRNVLPGLIVARTVPMMHCIEDPKFRIPRRVQDLQHMGNAAIRFGISANAAPYLASLGNEVVIRIDHQKRSDVLVICVCRHGLLTSVRSGLPFSTIYVASSAALTLPTFRAAWIVSAGMNKTSPALSVTGGLPSTSYSSEPSRTSMISSPGCVCLGKATPGAISTRTWIASRPGMPISCRWRSVRLTPACCASARCGAKPLATISAAAAKTRVVFI